MCYILGGTSPVSSLLRSSITCTTGNIIASSVSESDVMEVIGSCVKFVDFDADTDGLNI